MLNEAVVEVLVPKCNGNNWVILITNVACYSLRLGGFKKIDISSIDRLKYDFLEIPSAKNTVKDIFTDEEWLYIRLEDNNVIVSGWTLMGKDGELDLGIRFAGNREYDDHFFSSPDLYKVLVDSDGNSLIV